MVGAFPPPTVGVVERRSAYREGSQRRDGRGTVLRCWWGGRAHTRAGSLSVARTCTRSRRCTQTEGDRAEWTDTNTKRRAACRRSAAPRAELSPDTRVCTHRVYLFLPLPLTGEAHPRPPVLPSANHPRRRFLPSRLLPAAARLKWFVFDLTTTAATDAAAAAAAVAATTVDAVDGGTLFPPRTLPSFNVTPPRMCAEESHARLARGIRDRETPTTGCR